MEELISRMVMVVWFAGVLVWIFGVFESIGTLRHWSWTYRFGIKVADRPAPEFAGFDLAKFVPEDRVKSVTTAEREVLFCAPFELFAMFRMQSNLPFRGKLTNTATGPSLTCYLPVSLIAFSLIWCLGWCAPFFLHAGEMGEEGYLYLAKGLGITMFIVCGWYFAERWRFGRAVESIRLQVERTA